MSSSARGCTDLLDFAGHVLATVSEAEMVMICFSFLSCRELSPRNAWDMLTLPRYPQVLDRSDVWFRLPAEKCDTLPNWCPQATIQTSLFENAVMFSQLLINEDCFGKIPMLFCKIVPIRAASSDQISDSDSGSV